MSVGMMWEGRKISLIFRKNESGVFLIKKFIKYWIRLFQDTFLSLKDFYIYRTHKSESVSYDSVKSNKKALVFGNGPSLEQFLQTNQFNFDDADLYVCNGFSLSPYYEVLKPANYVLLDSIFFDLDDERLLDKTVNTGEMWQAILAKTTWPITLYTSIEKPAYIEYIKKELGTCNSIKWINIIPVKFNSKKRYLYYSKGLGLIGGITVTHFSLQIAILKKHEEVYMCGVDLNWLENLRYDDDTHKIYLLNKHFYDETKVYYGEGVFANNDLVAELAAQHSMFKSFQDLYFLANYFNIRLYRGTKSFAHFIPFKKYRNEKLHV